MIAIKKKLKTGLVILTAVTGILSSCNKDLEQLPNNVQVQPGGLSLYETIVATPTDTLFAKIIARAGKTAQYSNRSNAYTLFVADNNAVKAFVTAASGGAIPPTAPNSTFAAFINSTLPVATAAGIVGYYTIPQKFTTSLFVHPFPNLELPTLVGVLPGNPFALLRTNISKNPSTGIFYVNNIPLSGTDLIVGNSVIHHMAALVPPPQRVIWERINTDADLTIFKAALQRADSGNAVTSPASLIGGLQNFGADFTVLAPSNAAMKAAISFLTGGAIPIAAPDAVFIGFLGSASVTTQLIKGLAVYHLPVNSVSLVKVFSVNIPNTATQVFTLLNSAIAAHPGIIMQATFTGPSASAITVKGVGNPTASNVAINPTPDILPSYGTTPPAAPVTYVGTSDQYYVNGVLHKIDQVLFPQ